MTIRIYDLETGNLRHVPISDAAEISLLREPEIRWALDEFGICETETLILTEVAE